MKAWLKGGLVGFVIGFINLLMGVIFNFIRDSWVGISNSFTVPSMLVIVSFTIIGIILGFFHNRLKLKSYKIVYLFYLISFIWIILFLPNWMMRFEPSSPILSLFLFSIPSVISLIFSGIFWIFEKKQFESNFMVYLSVYLSAFAILVIIVLSLLAIPDFISGEVGSGGEGEIGMFFIILFSQGALGLSFIFLIIGWIIGKRKSKKETKPKN